MAPGTPGPGARDTDSDGSGTEREGGTETDDGSDGTDSEDTGNEDTGRAGPVRLVPTSGDWSRRVRADLDATDWTATPVVDVVHYAPATSTGLEDGRAHTEVHRHAGTPPRPERYATPERACRVERVTRPLFERLDGA